MAALNSFPVNEHGDIELQVNDFIDARDTFNIWYEAVVVSIDFTPQRMVTVHFRGWSARFDRVLSNEELSANIAPPYTKVLNWRQNLQVMSSIEFTPHSAEVARRRWYFGYVMEIDRERNMLTIKYFIDGSHSIREVTEVELNGDYICSPGTHVRNYYPNFSQTAPQTRNSFTNELETETARFILQQQQQQRRREEEQQQLEQEQEEVDQTPQTHESLLHCFNQSFESVLHCCICFDDLSHPVSIVPCLHTFCEKCVLKWRSTSSPNNRKCPLCKGDIQSAQRNHLLEDIVSKLKSFDKKMKKMSSSSAPAPTAEVEAVDDSISPTSSTSTSFSPPSSPPAVIASTPSPPPSQSTQDTKDDTHPCFKILILSISLFIFLHLPSDQKNSFLSSSTSLHGRMHRMSCHFIHCGYILHNIVGLLYELVSYSWNLGMGAVSFVYFFFSSASFDSLCSPQFKPKDIQTDHASTPISCFLLSFSSWDHNFMHRSLNSPTA